MTGLRCVRLFLETFNLMISINDTVLIFYEIAFYKKCIAHNSIALADENRFNLNENFVMHDFYLGKQTDREKEKETNHEGIDFYKMAFIGPRFSFKNSCNLWQWWKK